MVSKASEIQTVFIKQIDVNGLQETIFVDGDNHQVSLPQGVQVIDLLQDGTPQNDESNALSPHNVSHWIQPIIPHYTTQLFIDHTDKSTLF